MQQPPQGGEAGGHRIHLQNGALAAGQFIDRRQGQQAQQGGDGGDTVHQVEDPHDDPGNPIGAEADGAQQDAEQAGENALNHVVRKAAHNRQSENCHEEHLAGAELQGKISQGPGHGQEKNGAHHAADEGTHQGDAHGPLRLAVPGHGEAVQDCGQVGRRAGGVQQDGCHRAAENAAGVDGAEKDQGRQGLHVEGKGEHQPDAHAAAQARKETDE